MKRQRPKTYKRWRCPKCKGTFTNPIGLLAVACPLPYHGSRREPVAMEPVEEGDST